MLTLENISFGVKDEKGEKEIIKNLNLSIGENKFVVITGPNGGGKSTLAKVLIGIEKAESGKIFLNGEDITDYDINHRANAGIGYAFQQMTDFHQKWPGGTSHGTQEVR